MWGFIKTIIVAILGLSFFGLAVVGAFYMFEPDTLLKVILIVCGMSIAGALFMLLACRPFFGELDGYGAYE